MATARLPGIYFESVPLPPPALCRGWISRLSPGFLPSGPIGVPFLLEDRDRFQDVFGTDQPWHGIATCSRCGWHKPRLRCAHFSAMAASAAGCYGWPTGAQSIPGRFRGCCKSIRRASMPAG